MTRKSLVRIVVLSAGWIGLVSTIVRAVSGFKNQQEFAWAGLVNVIIAGSILWTLYRANSGQAFAAPEPLDKHESLERLGKRLSITDINGTLTIRVPPPIVARLAGLLLAVVIPGCVYAFALLGTQVIQEGWRPQLLGTLLLTIVRSAISITITPWYWFLFSETLELDSTGFTYAFGPAPIWRKKRFDWEHVQNVRLHTFRRMGMGYRILFEYSIAPYFGKVFSLGRHLSIPEAEEMITIFLHQYMSLYKETRLT